MGTQRAESSVQTISKQIARASSLSDSNLSRARVCIETLTSKLVAEQKVIPISYLYLRAILRNVEHVRNEISNRHTRLP